MGIAAIQVEFDHLFICTELGAPEAEELIAFGLVEGTSNIHPGQGTVNRRFFFHNAMLELLWVHAPAEAKSEVISPTHLCDRWENRQDGTCLEKFAQRGRPAHATFRCPFGISYVQ
jgi:hypothetical protein